MAITNKFNSYSNGANLRLRNSSQCLNAVHVAIVVVGNYGRFAIPTLTSLLASSSCLVHVHVLSDDVGWESFSEAMLRLPLHLHQRMSISCTPFLTNPTFLAATKPLPESCFTLGLFNLVQVFLHEVLPSWVTRVILLDVGDVLVAGDIAELWQEFSNFEYSQLAAVAIHTNIPNLAARCASLGPNCDQAELSNPRRLKFKRMDGRGFYNELTSLNPAGASLWHLDRARSRNLTGTIHKVMRQIGGHCSGASMHIATHVFRRQPKLWRELSSSWNYAPYMPFYPQFSEELMPLGLLTSAPLVMENACPPSPLILAGLAAFVLMNGESTSTSRLKSEVDHGLKLAGDYAVLFGHTRYFSSDMWCGSPVNLIHATGFVKFSSWWVDLFRLWGESPPEYYSNHAESEAQ